MSHSTSRRIRRASNQRLRALPLSKARADLDTINAPYAIGRRCFGERIMHSFEMVGRSAVLLFRHPTKKAAPGRVVSLTFAVPA